MSDQEVNDQMQELKDIEHFVIIDKLLSHVKFWCVMMGFVMVTIGTVKVVSALQDEAAVAIKAVLAK